MEDLISSDKTASDIVELLTKDNVKEGSFIEVSTGLVGYVLIYEIKEEKYFYVQWDGSRINDFGMSPKVSLLPTGKIIQPNKKLKSGFLKAVEQEKGSDESPLRHASSSDISKIKRHLQ